MILDVRPPAKEIQTKMIVDNPPAYSDDGRGAGQYFSAGSIRPNQVANRDILNPPSVDQVHIFERKHNIQGTFFIDPLISAIVQKKKHKSKQQLPHASFRSRHGWIDLELATTGNIRDASKAKVAVSTRSGDIKINLLPMPPSRPRMDLDVESRHGNITLFLPEGFSGVVHLSTRKGKLDILPALSTWAKIVKSSEQEVIFMMGTQSNAYDDSQEASFCGLNTRKGNIIIGLRGHDHYSPNVSFWKKLGGFLTGSPNEKDGR